MSWLLGSEIDRKGEPKDKNRVADEVLLEPMNGSLGLIKTFMNATRSRVKFFKKCQGSGLEALPCNWAAFHTGATVKCAVRWEVRTGTYPWTDRQTGLTEMLCTLRNGCSQVLIIMISQGMTAPLILLVSNSTLLTSGYCFSEACTLGITADVEVKRSHSLSTHQ